MARYFSTAFMQFHKELAANNNRDWFHSQKSRYEKDVKIPFETFVADFIKYAGKVDPAIKDCTVKDSIFRIHRDIRFSADKSPYKIYTSGAVGPGGGKKDMASPGYYLEFHPEHIRMYSGIWAPDTAKVLQVRTFLKQHTKRCLTLINSPAFVKRFQEVRGEKNKTLPAVFKETASELPLLYNKQWYFFAEWSPSFATKENLLDEICQAIKDALPCVKFLREAIR
jgi:uncharacterized protein (TIGR02453 family)